MNLLFDKDVCSRKLDDKNKTPKFVNIIAITNFILLFDTNITIKFITKQNNKFDIKEPNVLKSEAFDEDPMTILLIFSII